MRWDEINERLICISVAILAAILNLSHFEVFTSNWFTSKWSKLKTYFLSYHHAKLHASFKQSNSYHFLPHYLCQIYKNPEWLMCYKCNYMTYDFLHFINHFFIENYAKWKKSSSKSINCVQSYDFSENPRWPPL